jgi:hypothetical protein
VGEQVPEVLREDQLDLRVLAETIRPVFQKNP